MNKIRVPLSRRRSNSKAKRLPYWTRVFQLYCYVLMISIVAIHLGSCEKSPLELEDPPREKTPTYFLYGTYGTDLENGERDIGKVYCLHGPMRLLDGVGYATGFNHYDGLRECPKIFGNNSRMVDESKFFFLNFAKDEDVELDIYVIWVNFEIIRIDDKDKNAAAFVIGGFKVFPKTAKFPVLCVKPPDPLILKNKDCGPECNENEMRSDECKKNCIQKIKCGKRNCDPNWSQEYCKDPDQSLCGGECKDLEKNFVLPKLPHPNKHLCCQKSADCAKGTFCDLSEKICSKCEKITTRPKPPNCPCFNNNECDNWNGNRQICSKTTGVCIDCSNTTDPYNKDECDCKEDQDEVCRKPNETCIPGYPDSPSGCVSCLGTPPLPRGCECKTHEECDNWKDPTQPASNNPRRQLCSKTKTKCLDCTGPVSKPEIIQECQCENSTNGANSFMEDLTGYGVGCRDNEYCETGNSDNPTGCKNCDELPDQKPRGCPCDNNNTQCDKYNGKRQKCVKGKCTDCHHHGADRVFPEECKCDRKSVFDLNTLTYNNIGPDVGCRENEFCVLNKVEDEVKEYPTGCLTCDQHKTLAPGLKKPFNCSCTGLKDSDCEHGKCAPASSQCIICDPLKDSSHKLDERCFCGVESNHDPCPISFACENGTQPRDNPRGCVNCSVRPLPTCQCPDNDFCDKNRTGDARLICSIPDGKIEGECVDCSGNEPPEYCKCKPAKPEKVCRKDETCIPGASPTGCVSCLGISPKPLPSGCPCDATSECDHWEYPVGTDHRQICSDKRCLDCTGPVSKPEIITDCQCMNATNGANSFMEDLTGYGVGCRDNEYCETGNPDNPTGCKNCDELPDRKPRGCPCDNNNTQCDKYNGTVRQKCVKGKCIDCQHHDADRVFPEECKCDRKSVFDLNTLTYNNIGPDVGCRENEYCVLNKVENKGKGKYPTGCLTCDQHGTTLAPDLKKPFNCSCTGLKDSDCEHGKCAPASSQCIICDPLKDSSHKLDERCFCGVSSNKDPCPESFACQDPPQPRDNPRGCVNCSVRPLPTCQCKDNDFCDKNRTGDARLICSIPDGKIEDECVDCSGNEPPEYCKCKPAKPEKVCRKDETCIPGASPTGCVSCLGISPKPLPSGCPCDATSECDHWEYPVGTDHRQICSDKRCLDCTGPNDDIKTIRKCQCGNPTNGANSFMEDLTGYGVGCRDNEYCETGNSDNPTGCKNCNELPIQKPRGCSCDNNNIQCDNYNNKRQKCIDRICKDCDTLRDPFPNDCKCKPKSVLELTTSTYNMGIEVGCRPGEFCVPGLTPPLTYAPSGCLKCDDFGKQKLEKDKPVTKVPINCTCTRNSECELGKTCTLDTDCEHGKCTMDSKCEGKCYQGSNPGVCIDCFGIKNKVRLDPRCKCDNKDPSSCPVTSICDEPSSLYPTGCIPCSVNLVPGCPCTVHQDCNDTSSNDIGKRQTCSKTNLCVDCSGRGPLDAACKCDINKEICEAGEVCIPGEPGTGCVKCDVAVKKPTGCPCGNHEECDAWKNSEGTEIRQICKDSVCINCNPKNSAPAKCACTGGKDEWTGSGVGCRNAPLEFCDITKLPDEKNPTGCRKCELPDTSRPRGPGCPCDNHAQCANFNGKRNTCDQTQGICIDCTGTSKFPDGHACICGPLSNYTHSTKKYNMGLDVKCNKDEYCSSPPTNNVPTGCLTCSGFTAERKPIPISCPCEENDECEHKICGNTKPTKTCIYCRPSPEDPNPLCACKTIEDCNKVRNEKCLKQSPIFPTGCISCEDMPTLGCPCDKTTDTGCDVEDIHRRYYFNEDPSPLLNQNFYPKEHTLRCSPKTSKCIRCPLFFQPFLLNEAGTIHPNQIIQYVNSHLTDRDVDHYDKLQGYDLKGTYSPCSDCPKTCTKDVHCRGNYGCNPITKLCDCVLWPQNICNLRKCAIYKYFKDKEETTPVKNDPFCVCTGTAALAPDYCWTKECWTKAQFAKHLKTGVKKSKYEMDYIATYSPIELDKLIDGEKYCRTPDKPYM